MKYCAFFLGSGTLAAVNKADIILCPHAAYHLEEENNTYTYMYYIYIIVIYIHTAYIAAYYNNTIKLRV